MEESIRAGVPMEAALDAVKVWASGFSEDRPRDEVSERERSEREREAAMIAQNNRALAALRDRMPGLGV